MDVRRGTNEEIHMEPRKSRQSITARLNRKRISVWHHEAASWAKEAAVAKAEVAHRQLHDDVLALKRQITISLCSTHPAKDLAHHNVFHEAGQVVQNLGEMMHTRFSSTIIDET